MPTEMPTEAKVILDEFDQIVVVTPMFTYGQFCSWQEAEEFAADIAEIES